MDLKTREADTRKIYHVLPRSFRRNLRRLAYEFRHRDAQRNSLPDFYVIGTMKSGTTALFMHLEMHPDIAPASRKEIQYFSTDRDLGPNYFKSYFPRQDVLGERDNIWGRQIVGEATPDYAYHPAAPELCKKLTPNAKFIMLMRDPVERAFSHWKQGKRFGFETEDFAEALRLEESRLAGEEQRLRRDIHYYSYRHQLLSYKKRGCYAEQIENWLRHFDREQFMFIQAEKMFSDGLNVYQEICRFLGISDWIPSSFDVKFPGISGSLPAEQREELKTYFAPHNEKLYALLGERYDWQ